MKQRIDYIDRMKGLAIFLVVMGHVYGMVLLGRKLRGLLFPLLVFGMCFTMTWAS